jgi:hypothetical protein
MKQTRQPGANWRSAAMVLAVAAVAVSVSACGGGSSAGTTSGLVTAPDFALQGCTFTVNNSVPVGEPTGLKPTFAPFSPDSSANAAVKAIEEHGGTALVDSAGVPSGATLYSGPSQSAAVVGTVPSGQSILLAEPVIWHSGTDTWLAFFLQCGGPNLYWASLANIEKVSPSAATDLTTLLADLEHAPPYSKSHQAGASSSTTPDRVRA